MTPARLLIQDLPDRVVVSHSPAFSYASDVARPQCRQGSIVFLTIGILHMLTNITLVLFPIPMILKSQISQTQKLSIIIRLSLPLLSVAFTIYQLPAVIERNNDQRFRSLLASFDILIATVTTNAVVLASLLQDRGYKKVRYRMGALGYGVIERRLVRSENMCESTEDLAMVNMDGKRIGDLGIVIEEIDMPRELKEIRVNSTWEVKVERMVKE
ncbi:hypothetical protein B7494_g6066 [Chlorociboria aeruginascens]|nr:hypothetical protein B7494_g6066 [Chlorociboria aeruginascens]